ncbi:MAG: glutathione S-transferase family protein [Xanthomonadales bacterium]|nr:glutathione S-transferase family protein [Gammaproteobacteria bacterium]MBT8053579.1 glutathione S-transferase family protein [Gammaproteobacteria bacterium]NND57940.1 glutathione S-transferase family protein [Xanthomonadales bacterium]NNK50894.1 glutathione S-transferase family protein [Xanthomonadales bacterium]
MKLVIANKNYSSWSLRPWLLMTEFGLDFELREESLAGDDLKQRLLQYSPSCKVPVLIDGDLTVWDSLAICEYLSEQYLGGEGWPGAVGSRAHARAICAEMHSGFMALRSQMPMNIRARRKIAASNAVLADIRRIDEIWSECRRTYNADGDWLFGKFSIADCMYAPVALRFMTYGASLSDPGQQYMAAILDNPGVKSWIKAASKETEIIPEDEAGDELK